MQVQPARNNSQARMMRVRARGLGSGPAWSAPQLLELVEAGQLGRQGAFKLPAARAAAQRPAAQAEQLHPHHALCLVAAHPLPSPGIRRPARRLAARCIPP